MISLYKKYHIAYYCIGITLIVGMVIMMIAFWKGNWYFPILVFIPTLLLILLNASIFTRLASKKLTKEVMPLLYNCRAHDYLDSLLSLFDKKTKGSVISQYNTMLTWGYCAIDDYDAVYECCQNIKFKAYMGEYHKVMIEYYLKKEQIDQARSEIEELKKLIDSVKNPKIKETYEISVKNAEYALRIKHGNYEGAEEHYLKMLDTIKPLYPITEASYSYALGKLLILKGETVRAKEYLQVAYELGGDTKFKRFAQEKLQNL